MNQFVSCYSMVDGLLAYTYSRLAQINLLGMDRLHPTSRILPHNDDGNICPDFGLYFLLNVEPLGNVYFLFILL